MDINRCNWTIKNKKQCSRNAKINNLCTQHHKLKQEKEPKTKSIIPEHEDPRCFICLEHVSKEEDALFDCSYYLTGKGSCFVHYECGKGLRKLECPGCRTPITTFQKIKKEEIQKHIDEDLVEKRRLEQIPPNIFGDPDMMGIPFVQLLLPFYPNNEENDDEEENEEEFVPDDDAIAFALEFLPILQNDETLHEQMHHRFPILRCEEIDHVIHNVRDMSN